MISTLRDRLFQPFLGFRSNTASSNRQPARIGWIEAYVMSRYRPQRSSIRLDRRRIYILPTPYGYLFAAMLVVMFLWAINYNNSMCFAMTFLLAAVSLNAMWRTHANLLNLRVDPGQAQPVFSGQEALFIYTVHSPDDHRYGVALRRRQGEPCYGDVPVRGSEEFNLPAPAERRGWLNPGRLEIFTSFPLGLFRAWSWLEFEQVCLVYPQPRGGRPLPPATAAVASLGSGESGFGSEDYNGLRDYVPGDSPRHVAWKATARADALLVKRFTGQARPELWLDWRLLESGTLEARLSQLCQWVIKADREGLRYGLRLPGVELSLGSGEVHRRRCLEALALFPGAEEGAV